MKKLMFLAVVTFLFCGRARALTRMGTPTAGREQGQWAIVPEFAYSENDVERDSGQRDRTIEITTLLARFAYGLEDDMELFVRGGTGGGSSWIPITLGAGAKWTFLPDAELPLGLLCQIHWLPGTTFASELDRPGRGISIRRLRRNPHGPDRKPRPRPRVPGDGRRLLRSAGPALAILGNTPILRRKRRLHSVIAKERSDCGNLNRSRANIARGYQESHHFTVFP